MSHTIEFTLDGEPETTTEHQLTPDAILRDFGQKDPTTHYLVELRGHHKESYQAKGDIPIHLHPHAKFVSVFTGATPVSDARGVGLGAFVAGLEVMGYGVTVHDTAARRVSIDYEVETGKEAGKMFKLGFEVPADFPLTPPGGPHVSPRLHAHRQSGGHPQANIHDSAFGADWQYWSRPFPDWNSSKKSVATYMTHIWRLWDTQ